MGDCKLSKSDGVDGPWIWDDDILLSRRRFFSNSLPYFTEKKFLIKHRDD